MGVLEVAVTVGAGLERIIGPTGGVMHMPLLVVMLVYVPAARPGITTEPVAPEVIVSGGCGVLFRE
jgi:hypothetical protein